MAVARTTERTTTTDCRQGLSAREDGHAPPHAQLPPFMYTTVR